MFCFMGESEQYLNYGKDTMIAPAPIRQSTGAVHSPRFIIRAFVLAFQKNKTQHRERHTLNSVKGAQETLERWKLLPDGCQESLSRDVVVHLLNLRIAGGGRGHTKRAKHGLVKRCFNSPHLSRHPFPCVGQCQRHHPVIRRRWRTFDEVRLDEPIDQPAQAATLTDK